VLPKHRQRQKGRYNAKPTSKSNGKGTKPKVGPLRHTFHQFIQLPAETRCQIWDSAFEDHLEGAIVYLPGSITVKSLDNCKTGKPIWQFSTCSESRKEFLRLLLKRPNLKHATRNAAIFCSWAGDGFRERRCSSTFMRDPTNPLHIPHP
jgi:hypothetical protein